MKKEVVKKKPVSNARTVNVATLKTPAPRKKNFNLFGIGIIILLGIIIYSNSFRCGFQFDDYQNIVDNTSIRNLFNIKAWWNFYPTRPVAVFTFALNYYFSKLDVQSWHLVNLSIHIFNACLVRWLTLLIFSTPSMKDHKIAVHKKNIALFAALLFVSHPLATESVTYIVQRMASLTAMFYFLSVIFFIKGRLSQAKNLPKYLLFAASLLSGILALLTKENAFTLPFTIVLVEFFFLRKTKPLINLKDYRVYLVVAGLAAIAGIILLKFSFSIFKPLPPNFGLTYTLTPSNYLLTQFSVIIKYIQLLILPVNQMFYYDFPISDGFFNIRTFLSFIALLALVVLAVYLFKKQRMISFGIFWFLITLSIESSFFPINDVIFEHRTYLPSFGFFLILSSLIYILLANKNLSIVITIFVIIIAANSYLTFDRNESWKDELTMANDNIKKAPNLARPVANRGDKLMEKGQTEQAIADYSRAIEINPEYRDAYLNRGGSYLTTQQWNYAIADFSKAIALDSNYSEAFSNRGIAYSSLKDWDKAIRDLKRSIKKNPDVSKPYYNLGIAYCNMAQWNDAIDEFTIMIQKKTTDKRVYAYRGIAYANLQQWDKAMADYGKALEMDPNYELVLAKKEEAMKNLSGAKP